MSREPATIVSVVTAFLTALLGLGAAFGLDLSDEQRNSIIAVVIPAASIIGLLGPVIRMYVFSPATVKQEVSLAYDKGKSGESAPKLAR